MGFDFLLKQSDNLLTDFIIHLMEKGEREWFEVKRGLPRNERTKLPTLLSSISNRGGGLIFYGWDEENNVFWDVDPDNFQGIINQQSKKCTPNINVKFHIIKSNKIRGLFVGVPVLDEPVMNEEKKFFLRVGSHKKEVTKKEIQDLDHFRNSQKGHIYMSDFKRSFFEVIEKKFCENIKENINQMQSFGKKLFHEIFNSWEINFKLWLGNPPYSFPKRVLYNEWKKDISNNTQTNLTNVIIKWVEEIYNKLELLEEKYNVDNLKVLLKDLSFRAEKKTNHRKCLVTLVNQDNFWNFADARISVIEHENGYQIIQEEANKEVKYDIATTDKLDKDVIEKIILKHSREKCLNIARNLFDKILLELQKMEETICY